MVVDAFLLVGFLAFLAFVLLISVRRVPYFISPICFSPLIRVQRNVFGALEPRIFFVEAGVRNLSLLEVPTEMLILAN